MEFASVGFIWVFLPLCLLFYYLLKVGKQTDQTFRIQNGVLLLFSAVFYLWGGVNSFLLFAAMILLNYGAGIWIDCFSGDGDEFRRSRKGVFIASVLANLLLLCFFKYFNMLWALGRILIAPKSGFRNFLIDLMKCDGTDVPFRVGLPLAISFTVFQSVSYHADVYKKKIPAEKSLLSFSLFLSFFAQLAQGPIMRYEVLGSQIKARSTSFGLFSEGVKRFCYGLGKKAILANTLAVTANRIWGLDPGQICTGEAWLGVLMYALQIYYDFSGYSDMAVGV